MSDCSTFQVIPQFIGTCWFNAILMTCLFSQRTKEVFYKVLKEIENPDTLVKSLKYIIKNKPPFEYYEKIRAELLLFKFLKKYNPETFEMFKENFKYKENYFNAGFYVQFIYTFLIKLNVNVVFINYYKNKTFVNLFNQEEVKSPPDIIILNHDKLNNILDDEMEMIEKRDNEKYNKCIYPNHSSISNYENEIIFMEHSYTLDSCLLNNYNEVQHAITGITCGDNKYVYDGWTINTKDTALTYELSRKIPCGLIKFDWDINKDNGFCLNSRECGLKEIDETDLCFNFNKGQRLLVYVKNKDTDTSSFSPLNENMSNPRELSNIKSIVYDMYNLNNITEEDLDGFTREELLEFNRKNNLLELYSLDKETDKKTIRNKIKNALIEKFFNIFRLFNKYHYKDTYLRSLNINYFKSIIEKEIGIKFNLKLK